MASAKVDRNEEVDEEDAFRVDDILAVMVSLESTNAREPRKEGKVSDC